MALSYGFYPSVNGDRKYSARQWGSIFDGIINPGVYASIGNHFKVISNESGMKVIVQSGRAWLKNTWAYNDGETNVSISASNPLMDRWDAVCLRIDHRASYRKTSFLVKAGNPSNPPRKPTDFVNTSDVGEYPLAFVRVRAGSTFINDNDIENVTGNTSKGGPPFVSAVTDLGKIDFSSVYDALERQFNNWFDNAVATWHQFSNRAIDEWETTKRQIQNTWDDFYGSTQQEWRRFSERTQDEWSDLQDRISREWDALETTIRESWHRLESQLEDLYNTNKNRFDALYTSCVTRFNTFMNEADYRYRTFMTTSENTFNAFMTRIDEAFDAFEEQKNEEINEMLAHLGDEFASFWADFRNRMNTYLSGQETIWENWFTHIQGQLSEDAATHLQNQIDALTYIYVYDNELVFPFNAASRAGNELILTNPTTITPIPAFAVNPDTGHLEYTNNQTYNVDETSGHIIWDLNE